MLAFLEVMSLRPGELGRADAKAVRVAGNSESEISDAVYTSYLFNVYDRCADAMGWIVGDETNHLRAARHLLKRGYTSATDGPPAALRQKVESSVWDGPGVTTSTLRRAAAMNRDVPAELATLVRKTHEHAYRVTDDEIADLRKRFSDDELFEVIVAAALGAAATRADAAFAALRE